MASDSHAKRPIVVERRKEKGRKKTPRLTKTYDVKIIPATVGVVAETEEPPKKRVAAYCRVSTDQEAQETSLEEQMAHFNTVIAEHPDWELAGIYADEGISGTQVKHRVQFQQMIEDAKAKKIDLILTKSISRFARNVVDCLSIIRKLSEKKIGVLFESEAIYSLNDDSHMALSFQATIAEQESRTRSRSMETSLRMRLDHGLPLTPELLGFVKNEDGKSYWLKGLEYDMLVTYDKPRGGLSILPQFLKKVQGGYVYLAMWDLMNDYVLRSPAIGLISYPTTDGIYLVDNGVWIGEISGFIFGVYNSQDEEASFMGYTDAVAAIRLVKKTIEE